MQISRDTGIVFLRVSMGLMITLHGLMKVVGGMTFMRTLGSLPPFVPDVPMLQTALGMVATAIELVGGIMVMLGRGTRVASLLIALVLLVGFTYHMAAISDFTSFVRNTWPLEIMLAFIAISMIGPGSWVVGGPRDKQ